MKDNYKTLTIGEAAEYLGVTKVTLHRWDRKGILKPSMVINKRGDRRYKMEDLEEFVKKVS